MASSSPCAPVQSVQFFFPQPLPLASPAAHRRLRPHRLCGEQLSLMRSKPLMNNLEGKYGYRAHPHELHCAGGPISPRT